LKAEREARKAAKAAEKAAKEAAKEAAKVLLLYCMHAAFINDTSLPLNGWLIPCKWYLSFLCF